MADPVTWMIIGSTALSAYGSMQEGKSALQNAKADAKQLREQADMARAQGTREAEQEARIKRKNISDAQARMAGSGGTVDSAGNVETLGKIEAVGEYNALTALYEGEVESEGLEAQAKQRRKEGDQAMAASRTKALSTIISGASSAYKSYGAASTPTMSKDLPRNRQIGAGGRLPGENFLNAPNAVNFNQPRFR